MANNQTEVKVELEETKLDKINTSKVNIIIDENKFVVPYGIKYNMVVKQPDNALSKMYDEKNELIVNLRIPTNEYRDEDLQELIKWSTLSNFDDGYFRNLAIYMKLNEKLERTIVFTHAYIRLNRKINTKADYVDVELIVNQRGDKFVGVVFGEKLEETLKEAKDKVQNPPKLNIIVPVATNSNGLVEGWGKDKLPKITYKYKIKYYKYNKYEYEYEYESIEKRDEKANSLPASGYRYKGKNTDAVVTDAAGWFTAGKEEHTITTEYNRNPVTIYIKSNGKELLEDVGYVENGKTYILYPKSFFGTLGYSYLENNKKAAYIIQKDSGTKHTINKLLLGKTTLDHVAISDVCSAVQKDTNGTKVLWEQSTHTATFVLGKVNNYLINLKNDKTLLGTSSKKDTIIAIAEIMFSKSYDVAFIAGMLGNVYNEGTHGFFESSAYPVETKYDYLTIMDEVFQYGNSQEQRNQTGDLGFSGKNIMVIGLKETGELLDDMKAYNNMSNSNVPIKYIEYRNKYPGVKAKFGLGCIQWTGGRTDKLFELYKKYCSEKPTMQELIKAETELMITELEIGAVDDKSYINIYPNWKRDYQGKSGEVYQASYSITVNYERPADKYIKAEKRVAESKMFYKIMTGKEAK